MSEEPNRVKEVIDNVSLDASNLIVQLGQDRLRAQQAAGASLDQRSSQAAALQLVAVGLSVTLFQNEGWPGMLAAAAALSFLVGATFAVLGGLKADLHHLPGQNPSWWAGAEKQGEFDLQNANAWIAVCTEDMIKFNELRSDARAGMLGWSVSFALFGGLLLVLTSISSALQ